MYLTDRSKGKPREGNDHDELEVLLETFSKQTEEIVNEAENTQVCLTHNFRRVAAAHHSACRQMCNPRRRLSS